VLYDTISISVTGHNCKQLRISERNCSNPLFIFHCFAYALIVVVQVLQLNRHFLAYRATLCYNAVYAVIVSLSVRNKSVFYQDG